MELKHTHIELKPNNNSDAIARSPLQEAIDLAKLHGPLRYAHMGFWTIIYPSDTSDIAHQRWLKEQDAYAVSKGLEPGLQIPLQG